MTDILSWWNAILEAAAVIAVVVIAIGLLIGMIDARRAVGRIGAVLGALVLLLALPPILLGIWHSMSCGQQLGISILAVLVGAIAVRGAVHRANHGREH